MTSSRRKTALWEQFPGRCALMHPLDFEFRLRIYQAIDRVAEDEGLMILRSGNPHNDAMIEYARERLGARCVVCEGSYDPAAFLASLGPEGAKELERGRRRAERYRAKGVDDAAFDNEFAAWSRSKAWAADLKRQLEANGYTFDPATVQFESWGGDWTGCAATYPIQMGRAFGLAKPIERQWDLTIKDESPMLATARLVIGNVPLPENLRLFVLKTDWGSYVAEFWEGLHCPMERPHLVSLRLPPGSARLVDRYGIPTSDEVFGEVTVHVGAGGHTPYQPQRIEARPQLSLDDLYKALVAGKVSERA
jgi:hypothetical protein